MRSVFAILLLAVVSLLGQAQLQTKVVEYEYEGTKLKGYLAYDAGKAGKRPGVMVVHEWWGLNDYAKKRCEQLAEMGYVAFAADMYGNGQVTEHAEDAGKMATQVRMNIKTWLGRATAGLKELKANELVDGEKTAVIGYCFGGTTALQIALAGEKVSAVVSFHGALPSPTEEQAKAVKCKILVCHGEDDAFIKKEVIEKFRKTLDDAKTQYQFESYPKTVHSFTVKDIEKKGIQGLAYNEEADQKSWKQMKELFDAVFAK